MQPTSCARGLRRDRARRRAPARRGEPTSSTSTCGLRAMMAAAGVARGVANDRGEHARRVVGLVAQARDVGALRAACGTRPERHRAHRSRSTPSRRATPASRPAWSRASGRPSRHNSSAYAVRCDTAIHYNVAGRTPAGIRVPMYVLEAAWNAGLGTSVERQIEGKLMRFVATCADVRGGGAGRLQEPEIQARRLAVIGPPVAAEDKANANKGVDAPPSAIR